jgi:hypothetical protein
MMTIYLTWCKSLYGPNLLCILVHLPSPYILLHILWFGWAQQRRVYVCSFKFHCCANKTRYVAQTTTHRTSRCADHRLYLNITSGLSGMLWSFCARERTSCEACYYVHGSRSEIKPYCGRYDACCSNCVMLCGHVMFSCV